MEMQNRGGCDELVRRWAIRGPSERWEVTLVRKGKAMERKKSKVVTRIHSINFLPL